MHRPEPHRLCRPVRDWPALDQTAWARAQQRGLLPDEDGAVAGHRPITRRTMERAYGRWLTFLDRNGWLDPQIPPTDRITRARIRCYVEVLGSEVAPVTRAGRIRDLYLVGVAMDPAADLAWLRKAERRLSAVADPTRDKESRLRHPSELMDLGLRLMREAEATTRPRRRAVHYRDGLIIAFLAARPLRRRSLVALRLGTSFRREGDCYRIALSGDETKTGSPYHARLPDALRPFMDSYLEIHRPLLLAGRESTALWVTEMGSDLKADTLYAMIREKTEKAFGRPLSPHLFRDAAVTALAEEDEANAFTGAELLGNRSMAGTERAYNQTNGLRATSFYQALVLRRRSAARSKVKTPSG